LNLAEAPRTNLFGKGYPLENQLSFAPVDMDQPRPYSDNEDPFSPANDIKRTKER
jgi:hypothetical protein